MSNRVTISSEMFANYAATTVMSPDGSLQALQTEGGLSILLSVGSDQALHAVIETPGSGTGWVEHDLSAPSAVAGQLAVKHFAVAQNQATGLIDLAIVCAGTPSDSLHVLLGRSASDLGWLEAASWTEVPYDDAEHPAPASIVISDVFISQASDGEYMVVDILRDPSQPQPLISRYFVDPLKTVIPGQAWQSRDVSADIAASAFRTCLGRRAGDDVDGFYLTGTAAAPNVVIYQPLYDPFDPKVAPNPVILDLPAGANATALAVTGPGDSTDLYVAAGSALYCFPAAAQSDHATAVLVSSDPALSDVTQLHAFTSGDLVTILALNRADQVVRTQCPVAQATDPQAWAPPLPVFSSVEQLAPYLNRADASDTLFLATGPQTLTRAAQSTEGGTWKIDDILLPAPAGAPAARRNSFTTRVQVLEANGSPVAKTAVQVSAVGRAGVYVNNCYYVLAPEPVGIETDALGCLRIIEWSDDLTATPLRVDAPGAATISVNPMDAPFQRARALDTTEALQHATITANDGSTRPLVKAGTSQDDLAGVAAAVSAMATAYNSLPSDGSIAAAQHPAAVSRARGLAAASGFEVVASVAVGAAPASERLAAAIAPMSAFSWIEVGAGDLLGALESAGDYVVNIVKETGSDVWHFLASIAGKLYSFVFDAVGKVVAALTAVFRAIVAAIEDFILFLELLFEWNNILRTKDVVKKVVHLSGQVAVDRLSTLKADFDAALAAAQEAVNDWAGIKADSWQASVDNADKSLGFESTVQDIGKILTAPSMFLFDHLLDTVSGSSGDTVKPAQVAQDPLDRALQFVSDPAEPLLTLKGRIESELLDGSAYSSLDLEKILSKLAGIVVDGLLETTTIADTLLDALIALGSDALSALDLPVRIPLVSDILEDVFGIGIDFSMLDVLALVVAVPATIGYELLAGSAPFPAGDPFHDTLMKANAPADLQDLFAPPAPAEAPPGRAEALAAAASAKLLGVSVSASTQTTLYVVGNTVAGVGGMIAGVLTLPAYASDNTMGPQYETALAVCKVFTSFSAAMATLFVDAFPIENTAVAYLADATNALAAAGSIGFAVAPYLEPKVDGPTYKKVAAGFDMFCALMSMSATCYHFYELSQSPASADRAEACVDETATLCLELSRCAAFGARMTEGEARLVPLAAMTALTFAAAGLRITDGVVAAARVRASS